MTSLSTDDSSSTDISTYSNLLCYSCIVSGWFSTSSSTCTSFRLIVRQGGLEPPHQYRYQILNLARLPNSATLACLLAGRPPAATPTADSACTFPCSESFKKYSYFCHCSTEGPC